MKEVLADVSEHAWEGGAEQLLNAGGPRRVLPVFLNVVNVLHTDSSFCLFMLLEGGL